MQKQCRGAYIFCALLCSNLLLSLISCSSNSTPGQTQVRQGQGTTAVAQSSSARTLRYIPSGTLLYQANWSKGLDGWQGNAGWSVAANQLQSKSSSTLSITVPYQPPMPYYAIETRVQIIGVLKNVDNAFTIFANDQPGEDGYQGGVNTLALRQPNLPPPGFAQVAPNHLDMSAGFQQVDYVPSTNWHVYRIEVRGNEISLSIDSMIVSSSLSREKLLSTGPLGLRNRGFSLQISSFRITEL